MILVDSNIIIDVLNRNSDWFARSWAKLSECLANSDLAINPLIYAEVSASYTSQLETDENLPQDTFIRLPLPFEAAFLAGRAFLQYRRAGGTKTSPMPDFYIGAHAQFLDIPLMTRDAKRYRTYFPGINLICP